jgi:uncharacterized membrane protein YfcA
MFLLVTAFLAIAALYASVGFGGGSSYTAALMMVDTDFRLVPVISLICNLIVVSGGTIHFARAGLLRANIVLPFTVLSVPMAWLGGITPIDRNSFTLVLSLVLLASAVAMFVDRPVDQINQVETSTVSTKRLWIFGLVAGGALGFIAGLVGIGGGIFLAPALHLMRLAPARMIAAAASLFILVNSCAGLVGQWSKLGALEIRGDLNAYFWLFPAVLVGGQLGSRAGIRMFSPRTVRRLTAALVFVVGSRLFFRWYTTG